MHQLGAGLVEPECVENAGVPYAGGRLGQLESIFEQGYVEELGITPVDEEIDVFCSRKCLFEADIAFPMTVADAFLLQRAEESPDEHLAREQPVRGRPIEPIRLHSSNSMGLYRPARKIPLFRDASQHSQQIKPHSPPRAFFPAWLLMKQPGPA